MANYNETVLLQKDIVRWLAAREITFVNTYDANARHVTLHNVMRETIDGELVREDAAGCISRTFSSMDEQIPYVDANYNQILDANGQPIDGYCFTVQDLFNMLGCLFVDVHEKHKKSVRGNG